MISSPLHVALYEGKVITDKTYGHATYGCMICCGYGHGVFISDPTSAFPGGSSSVGVSGNDLCAGTPTAIDGYYQTWSSTNTGVFTMSQSLLRGVSVGTAGMRAHATSLPSGTGQDTTHSGSGVGSCPVLQNTAQGTGNVQAPTYFIPTNAASVQGGCYSTLTSYSVGSFFDLTEYVADQNAQRISISGMTPLELGPGMTSYDAFALPANTSSSGSFDDDPVGSCFTFSSATPRGTQVCTPSFTVPYKLSLSGVTYPILTSTVRRDCSLGNRVVFQGNPTSSNVTYSQGTVN